MANAIPEKGSPELLSPFVVTQSEYKPHRVFRNCFR